MALKLILLTLASSLYGFTVGSAHCWIYASRNLIKFPLLIVSTSLICALSYYITAKFITSRLSFRNVQELVLDLFKDVSILLASLCPPNMFIAMILVNTDDSKLGEYSLFLGLNIMFVALCGLLALVRRCGAVLSACRISRRRMTAIVLGWIFITLFVGGQTAFYLRPFFGLPATRGCNPPFALGATPDVRGAGNFYESVYQIFKAPPLPEEW